ncbi:hypothetical protein ACFLUZ_00200 [Chloroflexota bacterium]
MNKQTGDQIMNIARLVFGIIYLLGAIANIMLVIINGTQSYIGFADASFFPWYREAWLAVAAPNITLIVVLLIAFEICLGLLFIINRKYLKVALVLGILFCLASMPTMVQAIYTNLPLALIQAFLLWKELRQDATVKNA